MIGPERSKIAYCDYSGGCFNAELGCTPVSAGCANCYARRIYERWGRDFRMITWSREKLHGMSIIKLPTWGHVRGKGAKPLVFLCDMGDLFHEGVPADFIHDTFTIMGRRRDIDWLVLTKRPERMEEVLFGGQGAGSCYLGGGDFFGNIRVGVTVENKETAWRMDVLTPAWAGPTWVSVEPMLEPMPDFFATDRRVGWVVCGAETGPNRRPFRVEWAEDLYRQCLRRDVPFFAKQNSGHNTKTPLLTWGREVRQWPA